MERKRAAMGAALTGLTIATLPWGLREAWRQTNRGVVDTDFDCEGLAEYGLPCEEELFSDETVQALTGLGLSLMVIAAIAYYRPWQWSRHGGRKR